MNMQERRPLYPVPDFADKEAYRYIPQAEVSAMLETFGLGRSKQMVHAAYVSPDNKTIVGLLRIDEAMCQDHLIGHPIFQGVLGQEAMAQTWIVLATLTGKLTPDKTARIVAFEQSRFRHSLYPDVDVNIVLRELDTPDTAYGQIVLGKRVITEASFSAIIIDRTEAETRRERSKQIQASSQILFPLQE